MWKFIKGATSQDSWLNHDKEEYVFWGRSNVGKSSFINYLASLKVANTSSTPGRTKVINYFLTNNEKVIVDLPGYGFASVSKKDQDKINGIIDVYFRQNPNQKNIFLLIDCKVGFSAIDLEMIQYLIEMGYEVNYVFTKYDKANQSQKYNIEKQVKELWPNAKYFFISSTKNKGGKEFKEAFDIL